MAGKIFSDTDLISFEAGFDGFYPGRGARLLTLLTNDGFDADNFIASRYLPPDTTALYDQFGGKSISDIKRLGDEYFGQFVDRNDFAAELNLPGVRESSEVLAQSILSVLNNRPDPNDTFLPHSIRILEVGAGSAISPYILEKLIPLLERYPGMVVDFVDVDPSALDALCKSIESHTRLRKFLSRFNFSVADVLDDEFIQSRAGRYNAIYSSLTHHHIPYEEGRRFGAALHQLLQLGGVYIEMDQSVPNFVSERERFTAVLAMHQSTLASIPEQLSGLRGTEVICMRLGIVPPVTNKKFENISKQNIKILGDYVSAHKDTLFKNVIAHHVWHLEPDRFETFDEAYAHLNAHPQLMDEYADVVSGTWLLLSADLLKSLGAVFPKHYSFPKGMLLKLANSSGSSNTTFYLREPKRREGKLAFEDVQSCKDIENIYFFARPPYSRTLFPFKKEQGKYRVRHSSTESSAELVSYGGVIEYKRCDRQIRADIEGSESSFVQVSHESFPINRPSYSTLPDKRQGSFYVCTYEKPQRFVDHPREVLGDLKKVLVQFNAVIESLLTQFHKGGLPGNFCDFLNQISPQFGQAMRDAFPQFVEKPDHDLVVGAVELIREFITHKDDGNDASFANFPQKVNYRSIRSVYDALHKLVSILSSNSDLYFDTRKGQMAFKKVQGDSVLDGDVLPLVRYGRRFTAFFADMINLLRNVSLKHSDGKTEGCVERGRQQIDFYLTESDRQIKIDPRGPIAQAVLAFRFSVLTLLSTTGGVGSVADPDFFATNLSASNFREYIVTSLSANKPNPVAEDVVNRRTNEALHEVIFAFMRKCLTYTQTLEEQFCTNFFALLTYCKKWIPPDIRMDLNGRYIKVREADEEIIYRIIFRGNDMYVRQVDRTEDNDEKNPEKLFDFLPEQIIDLHNAPSHNGLPSS